MKKLAIISGLLFLVVYFWVNTFKPEENAFDVIYPSNPVRTISVTESSIPPSPDDQTLMTDEISPVKYSYLIVASFSDLAQANRTAEEFAGRYNVDMFVLPSASNGYYRVSHGRYATTGEALAVLETLKQTYFPDAWLLTTK